MTSARNSLKKGYATIASNLDRGVAREKNVTKEDRDAVLGRITKSIDIEDMADADYVVEAATEREDLKFGIFQNLDSICKPDVILASNTSSIPIGRIGSNTGRPEKVIGMHFMNPVPVMKLVEIIRGIATSDETFETTWELSKKFGKTPALSNDFPGFIANRIAMPMINEAVFALYHSVGTAEDIDTVMKTGF